MKSIHIISLGFCAVVAQAVFIREILALFTGTELVISAMLAGWLFWVGIGGIWGGRVIASDSRRTYRTFEMLAVSIAFLYPVTTIVLRFGRGYLAQPPGVLPAFFPALIFSLLAVAPFGFLYGMVYNVGSELAARERSGIRDGIERVYIWEAAGSLIGALVFSFVLIPFMSQLETTFIVSFAVIAVVLILQGSGGSRRIRIACVFGLGAAFLFLSSMIDEKSIGAVYPGYRVERFLSSRYGEIIAASRGEVLSYFSGGGRLFSVPEPERAEEEIHVSLLMHPSPRRVLLIGGSLGGGWQEAAKHPSVVSIDCVELDGALLGLALELDTVHVSEGDGSIYRIMNPGGGIPAVQFFTGDGRFFLAGGHRRYDVIVLNVPQPVNLQRNRYYTVEFFDLARRSLGPGGVFACSHPSSENFLTRDQARILRMIRSTLERAFTCVLVLPGSTAHFLAGAAEFDVNRLLDRIEQRGLKTRYITEDFLPFRFSGERLEQLEASLSEADSGMINTDMRPLLPLYELLLEGRRMELSGIQLFDKLLHVPPFVPPVVLLVAFVLLFSRVSGPRAARVSVMTVGFGSLLFQIMILLAFQSFSGHLYHGIVLLTALFMAGASAGAFVTHRRRSIRRLDLRLNHLCFVVLSASFVVLSGISGEFGLSAPAGESVFYACAAACGFLTGLYYPMVVRTALPAERRIVPAVFYAWDLFGACAGGLVGGALLLPVTGLAGSAALIAALHLLAAGVLVGRW